MFTLLNRIILYRQKILAFYLCLIISCSLVSSLGIDSNIRENLSLSFSIYDKLIHFFFAGILAFLLNLYFYSPIKQKNIRLYYLKGSLIAFIATTAEEFSQLLLKYRSFQPGDLAANYLGIAMFSFIFILLIKKRKNPVLFYKK